MVGTTPIPTIKFLIQIASIATSEAAMYSTSREDIAVMLSTILDYCASVYNKNVSYL